MRRGRALRHPDRSAPRLGLRFAVGTGHLCQIKFRLMHIMAVEMGSKRFELARQLVPNTTTIAMLINPKFPTASAEAREVQDAARAFGTHFNLVNASTESEIDAAFITIVEQRSGALIVGTDPFLLGQRDQLVRLAARHMVPTIYFLREFVEAGGLMSGSSAAGDDQQCRGNTAGAQRLLKNDNCDERTKKDTGCRHDRDRRHCHRPNGDAVRAGPRFPPGIRGKIIRIFRGKIIRIHK
jgi:hypothetical protein